MILFFDHSGCFLAGYWAQVDLLDSFDESAAGAAFIQRKDKSNWHMADIISIQITESQAPQILQYFKTQ